MTESPDVVDLGGCDGCGLGCAVACASGQRDTARQARQVLVGTGVALLVLCGVPALIAPVGWLTALGALAAGLGLTVAGLAAVALASGRPDGDRWATTAYRLVPAGVGGMVVVWVALLGGFLLA